jgi:hypothetical protein
MSPRCAVLYLAHAWTATHTLRFRRLREQTANVGDCYVLYQSATCEVPGGLREAAADAIHVFQAAELPGRLGYPYLTHGGLVPGCTHYPVIDFCKRHTYRYYWLIESDVEFSGDWATLIGAGNTTEADLLAAHVQRYRDAPDWVWWDSLRLPVPRHAAIPRRIGGLRKAFHPVFRISFDALTLIDRLHRDGCRGHNEMLLPTIIANAGLEVVDLNILHCLYSGHEQEPSRDIPARSTLRWRPEVSLAEFAQTFAANAIYHPVKGNWTFDGTHVLVANGDGHTAVSLDALALHDAGDANASIDDFSILPATQLRSPVAQFTVAYYRLLRRLAWYFSCLRPGRG